MVGLCFLLFGLYGFLCVGVVFVMVCFWVFSVVMYVKVVFFVEEEVLGWGLWGFGMLGFRVLVNL